MSVDNAPLHPFEVALLRDSVSLEEVHNIVRREFPQVAKSRIEAVLKKSAVPYCVAKEARSSVAKANFFSQRWKRKRVAPQ
jgi:hypothetical protein